VWTLDLMSRARVLVVEDDGRTAGWLRLYLEREGLAVSLAADGALALASVRAMPPDLVLLDLMLPGLDGFGVCRAIRAESPAPIIMITARAAEDDRLRGFELGVDDYITKPFSPREVVARVRAVLRRTRGHDTAAPISAGLVTLRPDSLELSVAGGAPIRVTPIEGRLLSAFMRAPGRAFTRAELVTRVLGDDYEGSERTIDAHVKNVRRKLSACGGGAVIETIHGAGYRLVTHAPTA
jgi:two-component system alkaline phosphatase synthesis response regulator PhoP